MTLRAVAWAWAMAAGVLVAAAVALAALAARAPATFGGAQIAVIGSSQAQYAFAKQGGTGEGGDASGLLGDGRSHFRIGLPAISEAEALALAEQAAAERAGLILLEVWPFVYEVTSLHAARRCDQAARRARIWLKQQQRVLTDAGARLIGRASSTDDGGDPPDIDQRNAERFAASARNFGLILRGPCDMAGLTRMVRSARAGGSRIVLVAPPRSATAERLLGAGQVQAIDSAARDLARALDVPLFAPTGPWPDDRFVSIGHLGTAGREQMQAELRSWIERQP